ncbi:MAG TPA: cation-translocating P-type ATPase C-terminal domain-containing protein, partial [Kofleriaceae bacterium]
RRPTEPLLGRPEWFSIGLTAVVQAAVTLGVFAWALQERDLVEARNLAFSVLVFGELLRSFASRSATKLFWQVGALGNLKLVGVVVISVLLQLAIHHVPWTQALFEIGDLSARDCLLGLTLGLVPVTVLELVKLARASFKRSVVTNAPAAPSRG